MSPSLETWSASSEIASGEAGLLAGMCGEDTDCMHARYYSPWTGRFLSTDPINSAKPKTPQTWNKYTYGRNNPLKWIDPDGRESRTVQMVELAIADKLQGKETFLDDPVVQKAVIGGTLLLSPVDEGAIAVKLGSRLLRPILQTAAAARAALRVRRIASQFATVAGRSKTLRRVINSDGSLKTTQTVADQLAGKTPGKDRSFIPTQAILETIGSGVKTADPQGVAGFANFTARATFNGTKGILEVLVDEKTGRVAHVLFKRIPE